MQTKITLGYLGFLPFAALTILPWIFGETYEEVSFQLLVVYGGIIISFLSGIIWGIDSTNPKSNCLSVRPETVRDRQASDPRRTD